MRNPYKTLEKTLGYRFRRRRRLETALTHPSFRYEADNTEEDNQRLEFLGDAVLGLIAGAYLFDTFPDCQEGELTQIRSSITNSKTLSHIAFQAGLGDYLRLGRGEQQSGGQHRASILSDALEAVIGAAYLDGGIRAAQKIFKKLFVPEIKPSIRDQSFDNAKGALQELAHRQWKMSPRYRIIREDGPPHSKTYTVEVLVDTQVLGTGQGTNKREEEMQAARTALETIGR
jgi:ribonuclease III